MKLLLFILLNTWAITTTSARRTAKVNINGKNEEYDILEVLKFSSAENAVLSFVEKLALLVILQSFVRARTTS